MPPLHHHSLNLASLHEFSPLPRLLTEHEHLISEFDEQPVESGPSSDSLKGATDFLHEHAQAKADRQLMIRQITLLSEDVKSQGCETLAEKRLDRVKGYYIQQRVVQVGIFVRDVREVHEGCLILKHQDHMRREAHFGPPQNLLLIHLNNSN